ncbi:MAG: sulfatase [bacterium]
MSIDPFLSLTWRKRLASRLERWYSFWRRPLAPSRLRRTTSGPPNLVVTAVDTLRWDHLGLAGYPRSTSPHLDDLAAGGIVFRDVTAPAPWTLPSFCSSLTGLTPGLHRAALTGVIRNMDQQPPRRLAESTLTLARHLRGEGYRTAAFYANQFFAFGLAESFDHYRYANLPADDLTFLALEWIRRHADKPFFCFLLYNDPHEPTMPPPNAWLPFREELTASGVSPTPDQLRALARWGDPTAGCPNLGQLQPPLSPNDQEWLAIKLALYDGAIAFVDETVGALREQLGRWDLTDQTVITLYSDHGEEFLDHAADVCGRHHDPRGVHGIGHGHTLFQELLHVPWLAAGPGLPSGSEITTPVSLCDIAPTLADWLGVAPLPLPTPAFSPLVGRSQAESSTTANATETATDRILLAEAIAYGPDLVAIREGNWKLTATRSGDPLALYDLGTDPQEQDDRRAEEPVMVTKLSAYLATWREATAGLAGEDDETGGGWQDISETVRRRLQELGYAE